MSTFEKLLELINYKREAADAGAEASVTAQKSSGKMTARERLTSLFDEGSFVELGTLVAKGNTIEGVVTGYGTVDDRLVYAYAQDVTIDGAAVSDVHAKKIVKLLDMAKKNGAPVVSMLDSNGARIGEGLDTLAALGEILKASAQLSGILPQISLVLGNCVGGNVMVPACADFTIMTDAKSYAFLNGPAVVKGVTGEEADAESFGGAKALAEKSGLADFVAKDDAEAIAVARQLLAYLPSNNMENPPAEVPADEINRISENLNAMFDGNYDVKAVIAEITDGAAMLEVNADYAPAMVTGLVRLNGETVGLIANQPAKEGRILTADAMKKAARFLTVCDSFSIPVVTFVDVEGFAVTTDAADAMAAAKLMAAYADAGIAKVQIVCGKAYGAAYLAMGGFAADMTLALPTAEICVLAPETAANIIYRDEIAASADPVTTRSLKISEYQKTIATPYVAAAKGYVEDVVEPDSVRPRLISALDMLYSKREPKLSKKHSNVR